MNAPASPDRVYSYRHRVVYAECTVGDHIYHSRYLDILEAARGEFLRAAGHPVRVLQDTGFIFPVIEARLRYYRPARYDDQLLVEVRLTEVTALRLGVHHRVRLEAGTLVLDAETRHVCTSPGEKPRRMSAALLETLRTWLTAAPPEP